MQNRILTFSLLTLILLALPDMSFYAHPAGPSTRNISYKRPAHIVALTGSARGDARCRLDGFAGPLVSMGGSPRRRSSRAFGQGD